MTNEFNWDEVYMLSAFDQQGRLEGTYLTLSPFLKRRTDLEQALLLFIAERHGVSAAVQLLLGWEQEETKWDAGQGEFH